MDGTVSVVHAASGGVVSGPSLQSPVSSLSSSELELQITELTGHLNAATHRWLVLLAEFDTRSAWNGGGTQSCAHWLNWKCGIAMGAAREKVRVAHALTSLPKISAAMAEGRLSYSKVRELTRVADAATEDLLLMIALYGTADHVQKTIRQFRRAKEAEELSREARQQANRYLTYSYDEDGSLIIQARLPADTGAQVLQALTAAVEHLNEEAAGVEDSNLNENVSAETSTVKSTPRMKRADALVLMAESFLANGPKELSGGDRYQIVVHVAEETLRHEHTGCCEIEEGPALATETARRLACDSSIIKIIETEDGEPLNVGRKTRSIPPALRRALKSRDKGCRFPGCTHTRYVDHHHIHHWADGGETKATNLISLCRFHHRLVHEGGIVIHRLDDGAVRFVKPDGHSYDSLPPNHTSDWTNLHKDNESRDVKIDSRTAVTKWCGERMDYGLGVEGLLGRWRKGNMKSGE